MLFKSENTGTETGTQFLNYETPWGPDGEEENDETNGAGWDDEDEEIDDPTEDLDDLHEIQADDDINEPDPEDEEHFPEEDE